MRRQIVINKPVAINPDGAILFVDSLFSYSDELAGATGTEFYALTQGQIDERNDRETIIDTYDFHELWKDAVAAGHVECSFDEYCDALIEDADGYFFGHDMSYVHRLSDEFKNEFFPEAVTFECVGGGRVFTRDAVQGVQILDQDLWDAVQALEFDASLPLEMFADLLGLTVTEGAK